MPHFEDSSQPNSAERDQFSNPRDYAAFARAQRNVFDSYREYFSNNKGEDGKGKTETDEQWEDTVQSAEGIVRQLSGPQGRKLLQENRVLANDAVCVLALDLKGSVEDKGYLGGLDPETRAKTERKDRDSRELFVETGKRLYADIPLYSNPSDTFRVLQYGSTNFKDPILKAWADGLDVENADTMMKENPQELLRKVEYTIWTAAGDLESARRGDKDSSNAYEISVVGSGLYRLEMLRRTLEQQIATSTEQDPNTRPAEDTARLEELRSRMNIQTPPGESEFTRQLRATREKFGAPAGKTEVSETNPQPTEQENSFPEVEALDTDWHEGPLTSLLNAQTVEEARSMLTPQMERLALSKALFDLDQTIEDGAGYSARHPGSARTSKTLTFAWGLSVQANLGAIYQRILMAKTGKIMDISEVAQMPVSEFMKTAFGYDLSQDKTRKEGLTRWTDILGHPTL